MKPWKNKKIILAGVVLAAVFVVGLTPFHEARGEWGLITGFAANAIGKVFSFSNYVAGYIAGMIFWVGAALVGFTLDMNAKIISQPIVQIGWKITLSFANLGFVLAIIVIAFATIFRMQSYAIKQVLWKLIVAALLVNFSLVIAGAFINIADTVTSILQTKSNLTPSAAADTFAGVFQIQKYLQVGGKSCKWVDNNGGSFGGFLAYLANEEVSCKSDYSGKQNLDKTMTCFCEDMTVDQQITDSVKKDGLAKSFFAGLASMFFIAVLGFLGGLTLIALSIMLLIRFIALGILLVLSPLVFLFWIFPATQQWWSKWWTEFIRWTFFAPAVMFFMYLTIKSIKGMQVYAFSLSASELNKQFLQPGFFEIIGNFIILVGFMLGGLYVANSLSITGAKAAYGAAEGMLKGAAKGIGRMPLRGGAGILRGIDNTATKWKGSSNKFTSFMGRGLSGIAGTKAFKAGAAYKGKGVFASTWNDMKKGSGLFKGKEAGQWECQNMKGTPPALCGNEVTSTKKPSVPCQRCGAMNWKKI